MIESALQKSAAFRIEGKRKTGGNFCERSGTFFLSHPNGNKDSRDQQKYQRDKSKGKPVFHSQSSKVLLLHSMKMSLRIKNIASFADSNSKLYFSSAS